MLKTELLSKLEPFQKKIRHTFRDPMLLLQVFLHRSYLNEHRDFRLEHNERLEFLGDAVLELVVTEYLYLEYPNPEGELTNWRSALVKGETLSEVAHDLGIEEYLLLSKGEAKSHGKARQLILANAFEALVGALYIDGGFKGVKSFIKRVLIVRLQEIFSKQLYIDPKSKLQELMQELRGQTPLYRVLKEIGPDHNKVFTVGVYVKGELLGKGEGASKNKAQQAAAKGALEAF